MPTDTANMNAQAVEVITEFIKFMCHGMPDRKLVSDQKLTGEEVRAIYLKAYDIALECVRSSVGQSRPKVMGENQVPMSSDPIQLHRQALEMLQQAQSHIGTL